MEQSGFLRTVPLFMDFDASDLAELGLAMREASFVPGDVLLEEGNANRALHIVKRGRVRVSRRVADAEVPLCDLVVGQTFGELSIIEEGVASAMLRAVTDTDVLSISMKNLTAFLDARPVAAASFWRQIAIELRRRLLQTNDIVRTYFEMNRALIENPTFREAYALCNR